MNVHGEVSNTTSWQELRVHYSADAWRRQSFTSDGISKLMICDSKTAQQVDSHFICVRCAP